ncbi:MAG: Dipeptide and tripeptide permease B [bacterium ADurb.Bin425]|nr:MAG: Dipeptide and tripeptide permease B [bacterium ADurb.Bin425]
MFLGLGIAIMVPAAMLSSHGLVSPYFLIAVYFVETLGEMCLSPVGLSTVSKLAPRAFQSMTMGAWFISTALGNKLAGVFSGYFKEDPQSLIYLFGGMAVAALAASAVLFLLTPTIKKLMGEIK